MIKIIADNKIPFLKDVLEPYAGIGYLPGQSITPDDIKDADALLVRTRTKCSGELLKGSAVKFIGTATIGYDHIDTGYCSKNGIEWINAPGCNSSSVQQYVITALLKISDDFQLKLKEKTIGIIGVGHVGSKVELFARTIGMNVLLNDPPRAIQEGNEKFTDLDTLFEQSDIITLHVPLTMSGKHRTYHMIDDLKLEKVRKNAWLINSSRGEVADTSSLKKALERGRIEGAVIDVWENEPYIDPELMNLAFIATPHIAGYSSDGKANGTAMIVNGASGFFGLPLKEWYPTGIQEPDNPVIHIDARGRDFEDILREAVNQTYIISADDTRLRLSPSGFEEQRGNYPARREFPAYTISINGASDDDTRKLSAMGFKLSIR